MAFGKSSQGMDAVASFRRSAAQNARTHPQRAKTTVPYFVDMYRPSTEYTDTVRLVAGEYLQDRLVDKKPEEMTDERDTLKAVQVVAPFISFTEHFDGHTQKGGICSAGPFSNDPRKRQACRGCDIFWETVTRNEKGRYESSRISRQDKFALSVFDYGLYHKMPQYGADGNPKISNFTKKPYFNWVKCQGQGCDACRGAFESQQGFMTHWPINYTQRQVLLNAELEIAKSCTICAQPDSIVSDGWVCTECRECCIDMADTSLKQSELLNLTESPFTCGNCGFVGFLDEVYTCRSCAEKGHTGKRATLFDVDLRVKMVVTPGSKVLQVSGFSNPGPVNPAFAAMVKPVDLVSRYAPTSLDQQAVLFGLQPAPVRQPQTAGAAAALARAYSNPFAKKG